MNYTPQEVIEALYNDYNKQEYKCYNSPKDISNGVWKKYCFYLLEEKHEYIGDDFQLYSFVIEDDFGNFYMIEQEVYGETNYMTPEIYQVKE